MKTPKERKNIEQFLLAHAIFSVTFTLFLISFTLFSKSPSRFATVTFKSIGHHAGLPIYQTLYKGANICSHNKFFFWSLCDSGSHCKEFLSEKFISSLNHIFEQVSWREIENNALK